MHPLPGIVVLYDVSKRYVRHRTHLLLLPLVEREV